MKLDPASDGWHYVGSPKAGGDARKIVTLEQDDGLSPEDAWSEEVSAARSLG